MTRGKKTKSRVRSEGRVKRVTTRVGPGQGSGAAGSSSPAPPIDPALAQGEFEATAYDAWRGSEPQVPIVPGSAARSGALLRQLPDPPGWKRREPAHSHLIVRVRAAAVWALARLDASGRP